MSKMRECICAQCAEYPGQFKNHIECDCCGLYGTIGDQFDDSHEVCSSCIMEQQAEDEAKFKDVSEWERERQ